MPSSSTLFDDGATCATPGHLKSRGPFAHPSRQPRRLGRLGGPRKRLEGALKHGFSTFNQQVLVMTFAACGSRLKMAPARSDGSAPPPSLASPGRPRACPWAPERSVGSSEAS